MFASWSAGEYGSVGATEWLEVRTAFLCGDELKRGSLCCGPDDVSLCCF